ncbi:hypothetical protein NDU88_001464 [Pleurodeles waltl]|uniref:Uncharacterized protein n=1 Tax=Pleurodeles waltl TaxID=8319 RepID=A0AAV7SAZ8_PLEWA|nr:hypothetical protein NDU88_001464 [Pleurodeles waltl]
MLSMIQVVGLDIARLAALPCVVAEKLTMVECWSHLVAPTAPASEWRCWRCREVSVTRCPNNREAGAGAMTPDFRVPGSLKSKDGLQTRGEDPETENLDAEDTGAENSTERKKEETRPGNTAVSWDAEESEDPEQSEDKLGSRHVPGGAWLSKVLSFLNNNRLLKQEKGDRRGEGRDGEEGVGEEGDRKVKGEERNRTSETILFLDIELP